MKGKNLSFGVFLLSIGILWLAFNLKILDWSVLTALFTLWPLLLVMAGVNIMFRHNQIVKSVSWLVFLVVIILYGHYNPGQNLSAPKFEGDGEKVSIEREADTMKGEIRLDLGGIKLKVGDESTKLVDATTTVPNVKHSIQYKNGKEAAEVRFSRDKVNVVGLGNTNQEFQVNLNKDIEWDMKLNVGAANGTLDMSGLKVRNLDIDSGAVNLELIFGNNEPLTDAKIDSGASRISAAVPAEVGVRVKFDGGLNSTNFKELGWEKRGSYYFSPNYEQASNKINFDVEMGVGRFEINPTNYIQ